MADDLDIGALFDQGAKAPAQDAKAAKVSETHDNDAVSKLFDSGVENHKASLSSESDNSEPTEEPGMLSKGLDFAKNLPQSAVDLIPGAKEQRENIDAYRSSPTYSNAPSDIPGINKGERDQAFHKSAEDQMSDPALAFAGGVGETSALGLAKSIPGLGSKLASLAPKAETAASRLAMETVGMSPLKDIPKSYDASTGKMAKDYFDTKGIGSTALDEGVIPLTGGPRQIASNAQDSIANNGKQIGDLLSSTQEKIDADLPGAIDKAGDLGTKLGENLTDFRNNLPDISSKNSLLSKIDRTYLPRIQEIADKDGNLAALQQEKQKLYNDAQALSKNAYGPNASSANQTELSFVQSMAKVVKEQIEKLAGAVDPEAGTQIKDLNQKMGNMIDFQKSAEKKMSKSSLVDIPSRILTGYTNKQLATAAGSNALYGASKELARPAGTLVDKAPQVARQIADPFVQTSKSEGGSGATTRAAKLYNATDDSLKGFADKIQGEPSLTHAASELKEAIEQKDNQRKNNAIFLLLQKSATNKYLNPEE